MSQRQLTSSFFFGSNKLFDNSMNFTRQKCVIAEYNLLLT